MMEAADNEDDSEVAKTTPNIFRFATSLDESCHEEAGMSK
jgi:hypothetical protein